MGDISNTQYFKAVQEDKKLEVGEVLREVYEALTEKGYNPINQIVGYLLSEDPTYITNHNNARSLICKIDRDELMQGWFSSIWITDTIDMQRLFAVMI